MKSVQVVQRGVVRWIEAEVPQLLPGHVRIRTKFLSLCGSDIQMLHFAPETAYPFPPGTTGHEMVGIIDAIGSGVEQFHVGDRVLSLAPGHRAMCEYYLAPAEHVLPLPEGPMEVLLQAQQLGTVLYAAQRIPNIVGKNVVVIGQGSAGLWFNFQLRRMGARRVVAMDLDPSRLERSRHFGATHVVHNQDVDPAQALRSICDGNLADLVVEAAGEVVAINLAIDLVQKFGDILYFGVPRGQTIPFHFDRLYHQCCRTTAIVGASDEPQLTSMKLALELVACGEADALSLITHRVGFDQVIEAYEMHRTRADHCVKIVVEMP